LTVTIDHVIPSGILADTTFETLFQQHWSRVYGILFNLVGEHAEAEDLALEVFWRLYQSPPADRDSGRLGGWLYRVAIRLGYNALRAGRRRRQYEETAGKNLLQAGTSPDPTSLMESTEQAQRVRQVLAQMKPHPAQALILRYTGFSYAEIAAALEQAPGSVGTILSRAERDFQNRYIRMWREE